MLRMKLAIITGASSPTGLATASLFVEKGFRVINVSRTATNRPGVIDIPCNLAYESTIADLLDQLETHLQEATEACLVHNARRKRSDRADNCDIDGLKMGLAINLLAPAMINRGVIPLMPEGSSVIYIGSDLSQQGAAETFSFTTCQHATLGMMRATAADLDGSKIHTVCVCPPPSATPQEVGCQILLAHHQPNGHGTVISQ